LKRIAIKKKETTLKNVRIEFDDQRKSRMISVGELVDISSDPNKENDTVINCDEAGLFLRRCGIKTEGDYIYISNDHKKLKEFLKDTPWENKWRPVLKRLSNDADSKVITWPDKTRGRATRIPMEIINGDNGMEIPF